MNTKTHWSPNEEWKLTHDPEMEWKVKVRDTFKLNGTRGKTYQIETGNGEKVALLGNNQEANARLIASAPKLLNILKHIQIRPEFALDKEYQRQISKAIKEAC